MRLIDADALDKVKFHPLPYTHITPSDVNAESYKRGWNDAIDAITSEAPTIEERKMGMWEEIEVIPEAYDIAGIKTWASKMQCNQCGFTTFAIEGKFAQYNFCPNCGADMRETP